MGRRLVISTLSVVVVVVVLLGVPLGVAMRNGIVSSARESAQADAEKLLNAVEIRSELGEKIDKGSLEKLLTPGRSAHIIIPGAADIDLGAPPPKSNDAPIMGVARGTRQEVVTVKESRDRVTAQTRKAWLLILIEAFFAIATAGALAALQARSLARPLVDLAETAEQLGSGTLRRRRHRRYGLPEVDRVAEVLERRAERISKILAAERQFAANASHQLRTPLTALSMRLEEITMSDDLDAMRDEANVALSQVERLTEVVEQLLTHHRAPAANPTESVDIDAIVHQQEQEWRVSFNKAGRKLKLTGVSGLKARATHGSVSQIIATLVENALHHGGGTVTIRTRTVGGSVVIEVTDEGPGVSEALGTRIFEAGISGGESSGRGLALARDLARADGARLELVHQRPAVFALFLAAPEFAM